MSPTLGSPRRKILWINQFESNGSENVASNMNTDKTQNSELLLDTADFKKSLAME